MQATKGYVKMNIFRVAEEAREQLCFEAIRKIRLFVNVIISIKSIAALLRIESEITVPNYLSFFPGAPLKNSYIVSSKTLHDRLILHHTCLSRQSQTLHPVKRCCAGYLKNITECFFQFIQIPE